MELEISLGRPDKMQSVPVYRSIDPRFNQARQANRRDLELSSLHGFITLVVCGAYRVRRCELAAPTRSRAGVARARQVAMYLAHVSGGLSLTDAGRLFGRDRTTAAHACRQIEDERDNPNVDLALNALDWALKGWRMQEAAHRSR